jgi:putative addiction module killer protein
MPALRQTVTFSTWLEDLRDSAAKARILVRLRRLELGNPGDVKRVSEMRVDYGPGYRIYFIQRGKELIVLLCGGDKRTQANDIARARQMAAEY